MSARFATVIVWWQGRSQREQVLLAVLGGVALVALLLVGVVKPLQARHGEALADIRTYQALATRLRAAGPRTGPALPQRQGDAMAIIGASAQEFGLVPQGASASGVSFTDAPYAGLLRWVASVEATSSLRVAAISIAPAATPGRVRAEVSFRR